MGGEGVWEAVRKGGLRDSGPLCLGSAASPGAEMTLHEGGHGPGGAQAYVCDVGNFPDFL